MINRSVVTIIVGLFVALFVCMTAHAAKTSNAPIGKVNINTASAEELRSLNGIGQAYADKIVEYRNTKGLFEHPEDIMKVDGIGPATWEKNKDLITVGANTAKR